MTHFLLATVLLVLLNGCESYNSVHDPDPSIIGNIADNANWYLDQSSVVEEVNVTVPPPPNATLCAEYNDTSGPLRPCTLNDIDHDTNAFDTYAPELSVLFSSETFIPGSMQTNSLLRQKGKSTRDFALKSYKVKLDSKTVLWKGERRLQFNKQPFDLTRIRNKLAFDLFKGIPNFTSLKTEFVHLTLDGIDKGLYTKVESYDKQYLLNRGFNKDDNLYKAQNFVFYLKPELALDSKGHPVNLFEFNTIIEPQRGKEQTKLIEMLEKLNAYKSDITPIINQYFNRENYLTWLAINLILGNVDTITQNYFLLNPLYSDTFYFLPWDYDDAFGWAYQQEKSNSPRQLDYYSRWERTYTRWWDSPLHSKFLSIKANRDALDAKMTDLRTNYLSDAIIQDKIDSYMPLVKNYVLSSPDIDSLPYTDDNVSLVEKVWREECNKLTQRVQENIDAYNDMKGSPMPFWLAYEYSNGILKLKWDESVDFEGDEIVYDIALADNYDFNNSMVDLKGLSANDVNVSATDYGEFSYTYVPNPPLQAGDKLFFKVIAKEKNNPAHFQIAFDKYLDEKDFRPHGVFAFEIK